MEPRREEQQKPKRFRIIKLEERIAPKQGGNVSHGKATACGPTCPTDGCTAMCTYYTCDARLCAAW